jgi:hypothetical protein
MARSIPQGLKPGIFSVAFTARLNSNPIDHDLSMGTPVKLCRDTKPGFFNKFLILQLQIHSIMENCEYPGLKAVQIRPHSEG